MMLKYFKFYAVSALMMIVSLFLVAKDDDSPIYTRYVAEITSTFVKEMYKKYGLYCGSSGGEMPYDVEEISVSLIAYRNATIEQARELEVKATERFVQIINAHEKIRPFLREYPFSPSRADVSISFEKKGKPFSDYSEVEFICHAKNKLHYLAYDPDHPYVGKLIKEEPYEEALKIVQSNAAKSASQKQKTI
jgi:hypothetical protein